MAMIDGGDECLRDGPHPRGGGNAAVRRMYLQGMPLTFPDDPTLIHHFQFSLLAVFLMGFQYELDGHHHHHQSKRCPTYFNIPYIHISGKREY